MIIILGICIKIIRNIPKEKLYNEALECIEKGEYVKALERLEALEGYKDSEALYYSTQYARGCSFLNEKQYLSAVKAFEACLNYKDAAQKKLEAEYYYVLENQGDRDDDTLRCLADLKNNNYPGIEELFDAATEWKAEIYAVVGSSSSPNYHRISFKVTGLESGKTYGEEIGKEILVRINYSDGSKEEKSFSLVNGVNNLNWELFAKKSGGIRIEIYDDQNTLLDSGNVIDS